MSAGWCVSNPRHSIVQAREKENLEHMCYLLFVMEIYWYPVFVSPHK